MSIVNEALKKAAKASDIAGRQKFSQQEEWILTVSSPKWRRPLFYGGVTAAGFLLLIVSWWVLQKSPMSPIGPPFPPPLASTVKTSTQQRQVSKITAPKISDRYQRGLVYYHEKRFKEAEREFTEILAQDPSQATAHSNLGLIYQAQGRDKEAVIEFLAALRINPNLAEAMNNLGLLYDQQGRAEEALNLYDRALKIKPDYSETHLNYAIILERLGYLEEARRHYQNFLSLAPDGLDDVMVSVQARLANLP